MKTHSKRTLVVVATFGIALQVFGQGTFQNLNFEMTDLSGFTPGTVPMVNALPGWQGYLGVNQTASAFYNDLSLGAAAISIHNSSSIKPPIQGSYSAILQPQFNPNNLPGRDSAAIAQTGLVPVNSLSLRFHSGSEFMQASFAGQSIPLVQLGITGSYLILGGDISGFAGQTGELKFTMPSVAFSYNIPYLDNIMFSNQAIPEPGTFCLFGLGVLLLGWRSLHKRQ